MTSILPIIKYVPVIIFTIPIYRSIILSCLFCVKEVYTSYIYIGKLMYFRLKTNNKSTNLFLLLCIGYIIYCNRPKKMKKINIL